jgi:hypothetical protein
MNAIVDTTEKGIWYDSNKQVYLCSVYRNGKCIEESEHMDLPTAINAKKKALTDFRQAIQRDFNYAYTS